MVINRQKRIDRSHINPTPTYSAVPMDFSEEDNAEYKKTLDDQWKLLAPKFQNRVKDWDKGSLKTYLYYKGQGNKTVKYGDVNLKGSEAARDIEKRLFQETRQTMKRPLMQRKIIHIL